MIAQDIQWCVTVINNASIRVRQRKQRFNRDILAGILPDVLPQSEITTSFDNVELIELLKTLPKIELQILYNSFLLDLTQQEISRRLNISQQQVSRIKNRALSLLRKKVS